MSQKTNPLLLTKRGELFEPAGDAESAGPAGPAEPAGCRCGKCRACRQEYARPHKGKAWSERIAYEEANTRALAIRSVLGRDSDRWQEKFAHGIYLWELIWTWGKTGFRPAQTYPEGTLLPELVPARALGKRTRPHQTS